MSTTAKNQSSLPKVLIIDDERGPRESLRILLKNEFDVRCADSVDAGMQCLRNDKTDLVVMDIRMPGKSGIDGLREIRDLDPCVSVVMLTGYGALETAQQALRLGANDYLNKPFETGDMKRLVHQYSQRSQLERRRRRMLADLRDMNRSLLQDLADKEQMASIGESSREFAHDLRNPLMIVSGYVELLQNKLNASCEVGQGSFSEVSEYLDVIAKNVQRCCELAHMWQKLGRSSLLEFSPTQVKVVLDDLVVGVEPLASAENVLMEYSIETGGAVINGNRAQLLRALHNLVANAVQAVSPGTGRVKVSCRCNGSIRIDIGDNGVGMTQDVLARLFDPYFTTKPEGEGTGLGTVIAKKIIEEHRGSIDVESRPGMGTTVKIELPVLVGCRV